MLKRIGARCSMTRGRGWHYDGQVMRDMLRGEQETLASLRRFAFIVLADAHDLDAAVRIALAEARETCPDPDNLHTLRLFAMRALFRSCLKSHVSSIDAARPSAVGEDKTAPTTMETPAATSPLRDLPIYQRTAAALVIVERLSHEDASTVMDAGSDQVREYVATARQRLFPD